MNGLSFQHNFWSREGHLHPPEIVRHAPGTQGIATFGKTVLEGCDEAGRPLIRCTEVENVS